MKIQTILIIQILKILKILKIEKESSLLVLGDSYEVM